MPENAKSLRRWEFLDEFRQLHRRRADAASYVIPAGAYTAAQAFFEREAQDLA